MATPAKILVAEDDEDLQGLLKKALQREGYEVVQAFGGAELTRVLETGQPDLIVLDVALPDADGRDLLANLKRDPKTATIPVIVWSGRNASSDRGVVLALGAEDYVEKGLTPALVSNIERILFRLRESARAR